jgi:peptidoglycan/LPS O-acetylase OafA/YrhL
MHRSVYLDVVRGLAALSVLFSHWRWGNSVLLSLIFAKTFWANGGLHPGVIVFVVLSGFVVRFNYPHIPKCLEFYRKRIFRIYPVYLVGIAAGLALSLLTPFADGNVWSQCSQALWSIVLVGGFVPFGAPPNNEILIVVAVFVWMYLSYPMIAKIEARMGWLPVLGFFVILHISALAVLLMMHIDSTWLERSYYIMTLYWIVGAISSDIVKKVNFRIGYKHYAGIVMSFIAYIGVSHYLVFKGSHYLKSLMFAIWIGLLLVILVKSEQTIPPIRYGYFSKTLSIVGIESYSLYAIHLPVLYLMSKWNPFISLVAAFCSAFLLFNFVERPFWLRKISR